MPNTVQLTQNGQPVYPVTDVSLITGLEERSGMRVIPYTTRPTASAETAGFIYMDESTQDLYITKATSGSYSWVSAGNLSNIDLDNYATKTELEQLGQDVLDVFEGTIILVSGATKELFINYLNGVASNSASNRATDFVDVSAYVGKEIKYLQNVYTVTTGTVGMAFYDSSKQFVSGVPCHFGGQSQGVEETSTIVPQNATFARFTIFAENAEQFYVKIDAYRSARLDRIDADIDEIGQDIDAISADKNYIPDAWTSTSGIETGHVGYIVTEKIPGAQGENVWLGNMGHTARYALAYDSQGSVIAYRSNAYASYTLPADTASFVVCFGPNAIDHKVYKNGIVVWEKTDSPSDLIGLQQEIDGKQKAISENNAIASSAFEQLFSKERVPFLGMLDYNILSNGTFGTSNSYKHSRMKVLPGDVIEFDSPNMTRTRTLFVCFLSTYDYTPTSGGTIPILNGTTPMIYHNVGAAGQEIVTGRKIVIPADCYAIAFDIYSNADPVVNIQREKLNDVVSHYRSYIQERAFDIRKKDINLGQNADSFLFFTDFHIQGTSIVNSVSNFGHSPALVKYLQEHTNTKKIFFGGDVFGSPDGDVKRYELMDKFLNLFSFAQPMFSTIGNHEWRQSTGNDGRTRDFGSLAKTLEGVVTFGRGASGNITQPYYYFDNPSLEIRYFVLYTPGPDAGTSYAVFDYNEQLSFVENEIAELDNSWRVVVVQHIIYDNGSGSTYDAEGYPTNLHTTGVGSSLKTFVRNHNDTSDVKIIAIVCGHAHNDFCEFVDGDCVALCNDCDATFTRFNGVNDTIFPNQSVRNWGTITEQCFDVYHIDIKDKIVYGTRIGYGFDKVVNITEQSVSVGNTITLSPSITPDSWVSQDESIATVANGAVTGVSAGRVAIKAREAGSPNGKWEYFNIIVS